MGIRERERVCVCKRYVSDLLFLEILNLVFKWLDWACWLFLFNKYLERYCTFVLLHADKVRSVRLLGMNISRFNINHTCSASMRVRLDAG